MEDVSDLHRMPLVGHDLPSPIVHVHRVKADVFKDRETGEWCWYHPCLPVGPHEAVQGIPADCWADAFCLADEHVRWCL